MATIIIADDDADVRELVCEVLSQAGHTLVEAHNGRHAIEMMDKLGLDAHLVITDMLMPEADGIEVLMACRQRKLPAIAISAEDRAASRGILEPARHLGARVVLRKPFSNADLTRAVEDALAPRNYSGS